VSPVVAAPDPAPPAGPAPASGQRAARADREVIQGPDGRSFSGPAMSAGPGAVVAAGVVAYAVGAAVIATVWPLATYTTSLAAFGLAHVLTELRYVDARFGAALPRRLWAAVAVPLAAIVVVRALALGGLVSPGRVAPVELALLAVLVGVAIPSAARSSRVLGGAGALIVAGLVLGVVTAPVTTMLALAVLHNATPVGFLVERAAPGRRVPTLVVALALFVGVPLLVASGGTTALLGGVIDREAWVFPVGRLVDHYAAYLPPALRDGELAPRLFSAAVTAQLLHYAAVIVWLPRTLHADERPRLPWPSTRLWVVVVVGASAGLFAHFAFDFVGARAWYGLAAAVHAWVEWPVLLAGLARSTRPRAPLST
jgi:hypothetical protein